MKITKSQLEYIIREELALVKEDWVDELYNALYALEDKVEGVVVDTELEQVYRKLHSMLKAHILEKSKVRDGAMAEASSLDAGPEYLAQRAKDADKPAPGSQRFPRGLAPELDKSPEGQAKLAAKQEYDALTTMITRLDGMESFLLNTTRQKSDEALTQQAAEQLNALHATLSQLRKGL